YELIGKAILAACEDAGIAPGQIDGIVSYAHGFEASNIIEMLGIPELSYAATVTGQGGGSAGVLDLAASAIETGRARHVVCIGCSQQLGEHRYGTSLASLATTPLAVFSLFAGLVGPGPSMALLAQRHMHKYGTRREAFAEVVMASRDYALNMPEAIRKKPLTLDEYFAAPMLADPLCRLDFCLETDGALAFVVTSADRAADLSHPPVYITAVSQVADPDWGRAFFSLNQSEDAFVSAGGVAVAERLYDLAGIGPDEIDVACIYDHFSPLVIMQLEDYGFCKRGEGGPFVESGAIRHDGAIPVNPHGGHLSEAYIVGATHIREAVEQLRGTAVNQVTGAQTALVTGGPAPIPMTAAILSNVQ
ncbi:MAG: thiolase, partial [Sphingobium sp.]